MSSVRVPDEVRKKLNEAAPEGTPLHAVISELIEDAGGPSAIREKLEEQRERQAARARVARLRRSGHRSVVLDEGEQVALAKAAGRWCRMLEDEGRRKLDPDARTLIVRPAPSQPSTGRIEPTGRFAREEGQA